MRTVSTIAPSTAAPADSPKPKDKIVKTQASTLLCKSLLLAGMALICGFATAEGDVEAGAELGYTCLGCHGIDGYRNAYPSFRVPKLGGQKSEYLDAALRAYRAGTRPHPTMQAQASAMSDEDIDNLVAWLATFGEAADMIDGDSVAGIQVATICVTCHGADGAAVVPAPPVLSGQHADYLVHSLQQYKSGARGGNVMTAFATTLSEADMKLLAEIYAAEDGLSTLE